MRLDKTINVLRWTLLIFFLGACILAKFTYADGRDPRAIPGLDSCETYLNWSEDMQEAYMKDFFRLEYLASGTAYKRCLDRYADEAAFYVVYQCDIEEKPIDEAIKETSKVINIFCIERSKRRNRNYLQDFKPMSFDVETCGHYGRLPAGFRRYILRHRIVERLTVEEAPLELVWCVEDSQRLKLLDATILRRCGAEKTPIRDIATYEISLYVDECEFRTGEKTEH